ncbi:hypothetical protein HDU67_006742 [Dinochytrium kinnereticum]|nr:hypothetical protein HDU67_006742 [Dinochytrium kinnereticum]
MAVSGSSFLGWRWHSSKTNQPSGSNPSKVKGWHWPTSFPKRIFADLDPRSAFNPAPKKPPEESSSDIGESAERAKFIERARNIIQKPLEESWRNLHLPDRLRLQEFVQSIPTRIGRPDLAEKLSEAAGKVPSPAEVSNLLKKLLTAEELKALTAKVVAEATSRALDMVFEGRLVKRIRYEMNDPVKHPEIEMEASVRLGTDLSEDEKEFTTKRRVIVAKAISGLLEEYVDPADVPIIGIAASGGGCRAMVQTLGGIQSLDDIGILDACTYMAGVSGSTWAMAQLYGVEKSPKSALNHTKWALSRNLMNPIDFFDSFTGPMSELVLTGAVYRFHSPPLLKSLGIVDLFGVLLTSKFLVPEIAISSGASPLEVREVVASTLSQQKAIVMDQVLPFPIYTAVTRVLSQEAKLRGDLYQWMEFTPFEIGMVSHSYPNEGFWIPSWSFGRTFEGGMAKDKLPETEIGILLGVFGSAFSADFLRIMDEVENIVSEDARAKLKSLLRERLEIHPIAPARFANPIYGLEGVNDPIHKITSIQVMDSEREIDIVIVLDGSSGIGSHPFLSKAESFAARRSVTLPLPHGVKGPCVVSVPLISNHEAKEYSGPTGVVYVPLVHNATFEDGRFDPASEAFTATHNFFWTEEQVERVASLAGHNLKSVKGDLKELIRRVVQEKRKKRLEALIEDDVER